jgi:cell division protein FtsI (penicillin-binding protein 3)
MLDPETKRYATNKFTSLFTGFVPAEDPRLVITVSVREPHGAIYGGVVAAPVFRNVAAKALPYLGVTPSYKGTDPPVHFRLANAAASEIVKPAVQVRQKGEAEPVSTMPDLAGLSLKQALQQVCTLGLQPRIAGSGRVVKQSPEPGTSLTPDTAVEIVLGDGS